MAKTTLRGYIKEIDGLIDRGQFEQALAHCRYLLKFFPKYADIYRLMAKAYLESQRYGDAADVFQRVLSSIPDDFVSQLGMSIIREDEGNLDAAIWHMERAYEIQPANVAIQSELRRLYGRRDGIEPPKIRLTRGALARMYYKGELFQQAIAELRTALAADPQRPDLQLLLAQSYARAGQKIDAVNTCTALLKKLPYCIEANRILAEILANTEKAEDAQNYRQRAISLNPYLGQTNPKAPTADRVPDEAIVIEKLDWTPEAGVAPQPQWAASLGLNLAQTATKPEDVPDWLSVLESKPPPAAETPQEYAPKVSPFVSMEEDLSVILGQESASQGAQAASSEELIPDWMKDAGWMPASGDTSAAEQGYTFEDLEEGEKLEPAEIPSWLKAIAPKQLPVEGEIDQGELGEVDSKLIEALDSAALPWLQETPPGPSDTVASWLEGIEPAAPEAAPAEGLPEWLIGAGLAAGAAVAAGKGDEIEEVAEEPAQTLEPAEPIALAEGEITFAAGEELIPQVESTTEEEVPDWLKELSAAEEPVGEISAEVESELPEWLASAPQEQEIEPLLSEGKPDLLSGLQPAIEEAGEPLVEEGMEWLSAAPAGEVAEQVSAEELPDWLRELKPEEIKREEQPQESEEEIPEWLVGLAAGAGAAVLAGELHGEEPVEMPGETVEAEPTGMEEALAPQAEISQEDEEAAYAWLEGLAAKQGASEALFLSPEERLEEPPEWIQQEATQFDEAVAVEPVLAEQEAELQELPGVEEAELAEIAAIESEWIPEDFAAEEALQAALDEALREGLEAPDLAEVSPEEFLPTWLRKAGPESAVSQVEEGASPEAVDITSWLSQMEESEAESIESGAEPWQVDAESVAEQAVMDWLPAIEPTGEIHEEDAALAEWLSQQPQVAGEEEFEFPQTDQWLEKALEEDLTGQLLAAESSEEPKPAWLVDFEESEETVAGITTPCEIGEEEGLPEWMVGTAALAGAAALAAAGGEEKSAEEQLPEEEAGFPTWLEEVETGAEGVLEIEEPEIIAGDTQPVGAVQIAETLPTPEAVVEEAIEIQGAPLSEVAAEEAEPEAISDEDAAFAWLESLAVRQGATEALLLTPEERLEEPPEWVQKESLEEEEVPLAETQPAVSQLESEMEPQVEPATEMEEELPEWLIGAAAGAAVAAGAYLAEEKEEPAEQLPEAEVAGVVPEAETASEEAPAVEGEIEAAYAWLESLAELQETGDGEAEIPAAVVEEEAPELPEWLADLEPVAEETAEAETIWTPEMAGIATQAETEPLESLVAPLDLNQAALIQIERLPGVGFRRAQALIEYRQVHGPLNSLDDLARVESFDRELIDSLVSYAVVSAPVAPELTPVEAVAESQPPVMERAQIEQGDVTTLLDNYQDLIHRQENLPQVVTGLQDALELRPQDTSLWMALGDAQMRLGQVKEALEAYSKAEELLV